MKTNEFTFSQMQHDLTILAEKWINKKPQIFQQKDRRRISFFSSNSSDQPHDRKQRQSTFQSYNPVQTTSFQVEKDNQNPNANSQKNAIDENSYAIDADADADANANANANANATFQQSFSSNLFSLFQSIDPAYTVAG